MDKRLNGLFLTRFVYANEAHKYIVFKIDEKTGAYDWDALSVVVRAVAKELVPTAKFSYVRHTGGWRTQDDATTEKVLTALIGEGAVVSEYIAKPRTARHTEPRKMTRDDFLASFVK